MAVGTAVRIQTLDSDGNALGTLDFLRYEIANVDVQPSAAVRGVEQVAQGGAPTLLLRQDGAATVYQEVLVQVRIHGATTTGKLLTIRSHILNGGTVRVFPRWVDDQSLFFDCYIQPQIITHALFSGEARGGDIKNLVFKETDMTSQVVATSDVIVI